MRIIVGKTSNNDVVTDIHNFTDVQVVNQYADSHESG